MHNKWAYTCTIASVITSLVAVVTYSFSLEIVAIIFGALTVALCTTSAVLVHLSATTVHQPLNRASDNRTTDSRDVDEKAMAESATSATADVLDNPHRDESSGLLSNSFFPVYLEQRITAARRTLRPVSLVIFELDGLDISGSSEDRAFYISAVGDVVKRTLRESDCAFRIEGNVFAAVMDDTAESGAVWAAERVRGVLHTGALAGRVTVSAGVACYPSHALEPEDLISSANKALEGAKARGVDQVEIAAEQ